MMEVEKSDAVVRIELRDAVLTEDDVLIPAETTCVIHVRAPRSWLDGEGLREDRLERVYETMYGATWREGNIDGSYFRVLSVDVALLSDAVVQSRVWGEYDDDDPERRYWFWRVEDDALVEASAEEL